MCALPYLLNWQRMKPLRLFSWGLAWSLLSVLVGTSTSKRSSQDKDVLNIVWLAPRHTVDDGVWSRFNASSSMAGLAVAIDRVRREGIMRGMQFK